jgi:hypothetical protein
LLNPRSQCCGSRQALWAKLNAAAHKAGHCADAPLLVWIAEGDHVYVALELMDLNLQKLVQMKGAIPEAAAGKSVGGHSFRSQLCGNGCHGQHEAECRQSLWAATCSMQHAAYNMQHTTCNIQQMAAEPVGCNTQHTTCSMQHTTAYSMQHATYSRCRHCQSLWAAPCSRHCTVALADAVGTTSETFGARSGQ